MKEIKDNIQKILVNVNDDDISCKEDIKKALSRRIIGIAESIKKEDGKTLEGKTPEERSGFMETLNDIIQILIDNKVLTTDEASDIIGPLYRRGGKKIKRAKTRRLKKKARSKKHKISSKRK